MRRNTVLASSVTVIVVAATMAWLVGSQIKSPAEVAARTAAPDPSLISVPVELHPLSSEVVARGTVRYGSPLAVALPASALKTGNGVVTTAPISGATVNEGQAALTVSGRPVLVLQGAQPAYRDLGPGAEGTDVRQLEEALARLGFDPGPVDGVYDGATASGVTALYRSEGWTPFSTTEEQAAALRAAQADRFSVRNDSLGAHETLVSARSAQTAAQADVVNKVAAVDAAVDGRRTAQLLLEDGRASDPPARTPELATLEASVRDADRTISNARADLTAAIAAAGAADAAVGIAEQRIGLFGGQSRALDASVGAASSKLGVQVPANEVLFVPTLPLRIGDVTVKLGEEPVGPVMSISGSQLAVEGALAQSDAKVVHPGAAVSIEATDLGIRVSGTLTTVADAPGTLGVDPQRYAFQVTPTDAPASLVGASVTAKITVATTQGDVLAVPVAGIYVGGDGSSRVELVQRNGSTRTVAVTPGLAAKGLVAVTPVRGRLTRGDLVVVGKGAKPLSNKTSSKSSGTKQGAHAR